MNYENMNALAYGLTLTNREKYGENPLITREMYAVRKNRSIVTIIRNAVVRLFAAKDESVR